MPNKKTLGQKLWKAFVIQAGLIGLAAALSIYATRFVLGDILIKNALFDEAQHFWKNYQANSGFPRPDTFNLNGYLSGVDAVPERFMLLDIGHHTLDREGADLYIVNVTEKNGQRLYLEFAGKSVNELVLYFGTIPLAGVLIVIYLSTWLLYRSSRRVVSPVIQLSRQVDQLDPRNTENFTVGTIETADDTDQEVVILSRALSELVNRIEEFVERERNFTRDASHELRSPITVIKIAADMILSDERLDKTLVRSVERIKHSAKDMEELIDALLLLAREADSRLSSEPVCLNDVLKEEIERAELLIQGKDIQVIFHEEERLVVQASDKVLAVMCGNLIRNAFSYTDSGKVEIAVRQSSLIIEDSGVGIPDEEVKEVFKPFYSKQSRKRGTHGVGLTIVKMLSDRFDWPVNIESELQVGTRVTVNFPAATSE